MTHEEKKDPEQRSIPLSSVQPSAHLPRLDLVSSLPPKEREVALAAWVAWFHSNRETLRPELESALDRALSILDRDQTTPTDDAELASQFDEWLNAVHRTS